MSTSTEATVNVASIHVPDNVRDTDADHVERLKGSIALQGILVPLIVKPATDEKYIENGQVYELVAGFHRLAAAYLLDLEDVPVVVRDSNGHTDTDRAVENIVRKDLTPHEEAVALDRALQSGLTEQGAAQALGWSAKRVTERKRILELPEDARPLVGTVFQTNTVDLLIELHAKADKLWSRLMDNVAEQPDARATTLENLRDILHTLAWRDSKAVQAWPAQGSINEDDMPKMKPKLRDRWRGLVNNDHGYERPFSFSFTQQDLDAARAAGCYMDLGLRSIVVEPAMVLTAAEAAVTRAEHARDEKRASKKKDTVAFEAAPKDPEKVLQSMERRDIKETTPAARAANEDLFRSMVAGLSSVELTKDVAVFFSRAALGHLWDGGRSYESRGLSEKIARRIALCAPELRKTIEQGETKTGKPKPVKVEYAEDNEAATWLRKWIEQPKEPAEILGRTLVAFGIATELDTDVVPKSVEVRLRWFDSDLPTDAAKALGRIVKPHIPGSLKGIRREKAKLEKVRSDGFKEAVAERRRQQAVKVADAIVTDAVDTNPEAELDDGDEGAEVVEP